MVEQATIAVQPDTRPVQSCKQQRGLAQIKTDTVTGGKGTQCLMYLYAVGHRAVRSAD